MSAASSENLLQLWEAAKSSPFQPLVAKDLQFFVAFTLLIAAVLLTGVFGLSKSTPFHSKCNANNNTDRSILTLPALGVPASLAFGFGSVFMICAVGVYV
ncbi:DNA repair protein Rad1 [Microthyrium microscopicum]|uniref:Dolichyl-diphosphooligosaccharide-protein glycosyltransferase subunit OST5 n=1 Tax=Microthyrium microscopicum TaxID=703497 RepID=A0A6A6TWS2_9PEZI|nr:DNA repair protein Rad1 [Microthyrium microscopicum]